MIDLPEDVVRELEGMDVCQSVTACALKGEATLMKLAGRNAPNPDHEVVKKLFSILRRLVAMSDVPKVTRTCSYDKYLTGDDRYNLAKKATRFSSIKPTHLEGRAGVILSLLMKAIRALITLEMFNMLKDISPNEMNIGIRSDWTIVAVPDSLRTAS